ncbi:OmpA/MotB family protein [Aquimarina intermedia]|uniref:Chemotaxis protein MotB n=1 Tax=Aquimarina intermedia TaxID=350814 RepID=A0A5S5C0J7_9FLAO|nr:OmpA family protein [Aquimarina intermedia]TYP72807.1 chemotaxis protein MotB [Aquimarina intermedia]
MNKLYTLFILLVVSFQTMNAQKKKDLLEEINQLRQELRVSQGQVSDYQRKEVASQAQIASLEKQVEDLRESNTSLLSNMGSFTALSKKKAENLESSLVSLQLKDKKINAINDAFSKNDSIKLAVLTKFKQAVGNDAAIGVQQGAVYITIPNSLLFGDDDKNYSLQDKSKALLSRIGTVLVANPDLKIAVEGNSNALKFEKTELRSNWDLSSLQAAAVIQSLQEEFKVLPKQMEVLGKSEYATEGIETVTRIRVDPGFKDFYIQIKDNMKE